MVALTGVERAKGQFRPVQLGLSRAFYVELVPADLQPRPPHHRPRAKAAIHLFMNGGPSQMDLFDPKPQLDKHHGEAYFDKIAGEVENVKDAGALMRSPFKFARRGECGMWVSDALPHLARHVDFDEEECGYEGCSGERERGDWRRFGVESR